MELRQLQYFRAIVEAGSITQGAKRLHLSQPPLSYQMNKLEEELGTQLFIRGKKSIELTEAGRLLYERSENLLELERMTAREVSEAGKRNLLRIGMAPTTVPLVSETIAEFSKEHPEIRFSLHEGSTFTQMEMLSRHDIDCSLVRTPVNTRGMKTMSVRKESMYAVSSGRLKRGKYISLQELSKHPLIIYRRYHDFIMDAFHKHGLPCDVICECDDARTVLTLARNGIGVGIFPAALLAVTSQVEIYEIQEKDLESEILLAYPEDIQPAEHVYLFMKETIRTAQEETTLTQILS